MLDIYPVVLLLHRPKATTDLATESCLPVACACVSFPHRLVDIVGKAVFKSF